MDYPRLTVKELLIEASVIGILTVLVGLLAGWIAKSIVGVGRNCEGWNDTHVMELSLFLTGFLLHAGFEVAGLN
jgi:hypothetical protein